MGISASTILSFMPLTVTNVSYFSDVTAVWPRPSTSEQGVQINGIFVGQS